MIQKLPTLFKRNQNKNINQWTIFVENNQYWCEYGVVDGKLITDPPTTVSGKNVGKTNETTDEEQALKEAKAKWEKKVESGMFEDVACVDDPVWFKPMLALDFKKRKDVTYPLIVEPKLDGCRCISTSFDLRSRNGKSFYSVPHILQGLQILKENDINFTLDGELYTHEYHDDFNRIISLVRKSKPTEDDIYESELKVEYWIYDFPVIGHLTSEDPYTTRLNYFLKEVYPLLDKKIFKVIPYEYVQNFEELEQCFERYIELGYEGLIARNPNSEYESGKRSSNLLKYKNFQDREYVIVDIVEGEGKRSGMAGYIQFENFKSNIKGGFEFYKDLLLNKEQYIGKKATVRFFNLTPDGIPRFPYVVAIRDYE